jgi:hypothetical protein
MGARLAHPHPFEGMRLIVHRAPGGRLTPQRP